ncbi:fimbrial protein [Caenimonas aquaedulcis]|uniref:Type 1 fimbrial protein n=1 Tax=Caenimonas aquaedulcis TaxID=2793270 RepID=A0A931MJD1_9BURK|nr:fimbrial protein [Caenimonas aquaedulcis]MBG9390663.1 type 1 fimbrial protein [Caenimonas aquaedulcis]
MISIPRIAGRALVAVSALAASWACHAVDGTVTINGIVTNETCTINGGGSASSFTVTLPRVSSAALASAGAVAGRTSFSLALTGCSGFSSGTVFAYFEPGPTINAAGRLINAGTATNLDIELLNSSFGSVNLMQNSGSQNATTAGVSASAATLTHYAQYRATGAVAPGTVSTSVTYTIVYP